MKFSFQKCNLFQNSMNELKFMPKIWHVVFWQKTNTLTKEIRDENLNIIKMWKELYGWIVKREINVVMVFIFVCIETHVNLTESMNKNVRNFSCLQKKYISDLRRTSKPLGWITKKNPTLRLSVSQGSYFGAHQIWCAPNSNNAFLKFGTCQMYCIALTISQYHSLSLPLFVSAIYTLNITFFFYNA